MSYAQTHRLQTDRVETTSGITIIPFDPASLIYLKYSEQNVQINSTAGATGVVLPALAEAPLCDIMIMNRGANAVTIRAKEDEATTIVTLAADTNYAIMRSTGIQWLEITTTIVYP